MLTIDTREPKTLIRNLVYTVNGAAPTLPKSWQGVGEWRDGKCAVRALPYGDFLIQTPKDHLIIERKAAQDLLSTYVKKKVGDGGQLVSRLRWQLAGCAAGFPTRVALLVEGTLEEQHTTGFTIANGYLRQVKFQAVQRLLLDLQYEGYKLIRTADTADTVSTIASLHNSLRNPIKELV